MDKSKGELMEAFMLNDVPALMRQVISANGHQPLPRVVIIKDSGTSGHATVGIIFMGILENIKWQFLGNRAAKNGVQSPLISFGHKIHPQPDLPQCFKAYIRVKGVKAGSVVDFQMRGAKIVFGQTAGGKTGK